ncbi:hypothetical protein C8J57DRAFT_1095616, partial [Mycena rebaudengoi]
MCLLGTAPSPDGPTVGRYNPFLKLVVRDFNEFWDPGVYFTRTHKYRLGRKAKGMLVPLPSDMLAARAAGGFTSATSTHFCIGCDLTMNHIEEFDKTQWPQRDHTSHLQHAHTWKNATTVAEQEKIALKTGIRYSVLLELPYWKAVRFMLIEPMHILDLRLIEIHCRELLRIDL